MTLPRRTFVLVALLTLTAFAVTAYALLRPTPIDWQTVETHGYTLNVPGDWERSGNGYTGILERLRKGNFDSYDIDDSCDGRSHTATLEIWENDASSFRYRKSDGTGGNLLTKEDAYNYISSNRGEVVLERELSNDAILVVGDGRYGSAPCIGSQHIGFILDGEKAIWIRMLMDENREDIVFPLYESITPR